MRHARAQRVMHIAYHDLAHIRHYLRLAKGSHPGSTQLGEPEIIEMSDQQKCRCDPEQGAQRKGYNNPANGT